MSLSLSRVYSIISLTLSHLGLHPSSSASFGGPLCTQIASADAIVTSPLASSVLAPSARGEGWRREGVGEGAVSPQRVGAHVCGRRGEGEGGGRRESLCLAGCFIGFNVCDKEGKVGFAVEKFEIGEEKRVYWLVYS